MAGVIKLKKDLTKTVLGIQLLAALLVLGAIYIWAPVCSGLLTLQNGSLVHMKCFYTAQAAKVLSITLLTAVVAAYHTKTDLNKIQAVIAIIGVTIIAITYESSLGIGICRAPMECHATAAWLRGSGALIVVAALTQVFVNTSAGRTIKSGTAQVGDGVS